MINLGENDEYGQIGVIDSCGLEDYMFAIFLWFGYFKIMLW